jgi:DNA-directed RNA polymerase subunit RPC12/RpoP
MHRVLDLESYAKNVIRNQDKGQMVEIECLACGKTVKLPKFINTDKYDGQVVCQECSALLHVKLVKGKVEKYKVLEKNTRPVTIIFEPAHKTEEEGSIAKDKEGS